MIELKGKKPVSKINPSNSFEVCEVIPVRILSRTELGHRDWSLWLLFSSRLMRSVK